MPLGNSTGRKSPLGVLPMALALMLSAFVGAVAGLIWQSSDWFSEEPEEQVLTREQR